MLNVQTFLVNHGLNTLVEQYKIKVSDYPDRVVLNYDQIESPRFDPICDECRGLILAKDDRWSVMARSFSRFYNVGEDPNTASFPIQDKYTRVEQKIDGSILTLYWDWFNKKWQCSTRSMAFAEGSTVIGNTFAQVFEKAIEGTVLRGSISLCSSDWCFVFELCSPETRVVTPFTDYQVSLLAIRDLKTDLELSGDEVDTFSKMSKVKRPLRIEADSIEKVIEEANKLPAMQEGFVIISEKEKVFWRLKCKNTKYLAVARLRNNGVLSPKRMLHLIMENDHYEYLQYFPEDSKYFNFIETEYKDALECVEVLWEKYNNLVSQKDFALSIIQECHYDWQKGVLFNMRKGLSLTQAMKMSDPKKIAKIMNFQEKLKNKFNIEISD